MRRFEGKKVLVVGGGMGMGRAIADSFSAEGATLVISEITLQAGQEAAAAIKARVGSSFLVHCNISNRAEVKAMVDEAARLA